MNVYGTREIDNRDSAQMYEYMEARIEVLKRRISELEKENQMLRLSRKEFHIAASHHQAAFEKITPFIASTHS